MSLNQKSLAALQSQIEEMIDSTASVKGEAFANVSAGLFELQQLCMVIASIQKIAERAEVDVSEFTSIASRFALSASARMLLAIPVGERDEAIVMARALEGKRVEGAKRRCGT